MITTLKLFSLKIANTWKKSSAIIVIRKWKDSLETPAGLLIFLLELEISGVAVQNIHKNSENGDFCEELLRENVFETVLAPLCCYDHGAKASEAVQKIATDLEEYHKCSSCVIIC